MALRITFVIPHLTLSGGHKIVFTYADGLAARGHSVTVVSGALPLVSPIDRVRNFLSGHPLAEPYLPGSAVGVVLTKHRDAALVNDLPDADILIGTWWETVESVKYAPKSKGVKCHLVQGHEVFPYLPADRTDAVYRLPFHKIAVSEWLSDVMRLNYGDDCVDLLMNPIDIRNFPLIPRHMATVPTVGTVFSSTSVKNSAMALDVVMRVRHHIPDLRFVGFGTDEVPAQWSGTPSVEFQVRPTQDEIARIYASADFWLFTSDSEGFGLPILEAMASGTPVIATPAGAARELIDDATGALVGHDSEEMAAALIRLFSVGEDKWQHLSSNCRTRAEAYDVDQAVDRLEEIVTRLAAC